MVILLLVDCEIQLLNVDIPVCLDFMPGQKRITKRRVQE
uniref:Uncharacterized protein n=1 Tax=Rhizophora mucronata TaxID=61149 RepID=A0A2P2PER1_RHIMU